eukprot:COSAG04_NODE_234_length_19155_cov_812.438707_3_plen_133_part_00
MLTPAEAVAKPADATWMLVDKDDLSGRYPAACGGAWGLYFLLLAGLGGAAYVGGGAAYGKRRGGGGGGGSTLEAHPHWGHWKELQSLAMDGVAFSRARMGGGRGGYRRVGVSRKDITAIWVAFFSRCQRYRC